MMTKDDLVLICHKIFNRLNKLRLSYSWHNRRWILEKEKSKNTN